jgi:hypothetical protein
MIARVGPALVGLVISCWNAGAPAADCAAEAAMLAREQSELPRLEVASPADPSAVLHHAGDGDRLRGRIRMHVARCRRSDFAAAAADWSRTRNDYAKLFGRYRCKRTR